MRQQIVAIYDVAYSHWAHMWSFLRSWTPLMCLARLLLRAMVRSQKGYLYGFTFSWTFVMWRAVLAGMGDAKSQWGLYL